MKTVHEQDFGYKVAKFGGVGKLQQDSVEHFERDCEIRWSSSKQIVKVEGDSFKEGSTPCKAASSSIH